MTWVMVVPEVALAPAGAGARIVAANDAATAKGTTASAHWSLGRVTGLRRWRMAMRRRVPITGMRPLCFRGCAAIVFRGSISNVPTYGTADPGTPQPGPRAAGAG